MPLIYPRIITAYGDNVTGDAPTLLGKPNDHVSLGFLREHGDRPGGDPVETIDYAVADGVAHLTPPCPASLNAISKQLSAELAATMAEVEGRSGRACRPAVRNGTVVLRRSRPGGYPTMHAAEDIVGQLVASRDNGSDSFVGVCMKLVVARDRGVGGRRRRRDGDRRRHRHRHEYGPVFLSRSASASCPAGRVSPGSCGRSVRSGRRASCSSVSGSTPREHWTSGSVSQATLAGADLDRSLRWQPRRSCSTLWWWCASPSRRS